MKEMIEEPPVHGGDSTLTFGRAMSMGRPRTKGTVDAVLLALLLLGVPNHGTAATITNYVGDGWAQYWFNVNAGDTVVWVNEQPLYLGTNFVESYGGEWSSPPMVNLGDSFSFTFTNAGFYAYRTGAIGWDGTKGLPGVVTVNAWTGAPPAVTILTPLDGSFSLAGPQVLQAWVTNTANITEIQYFAGTNLMGIGTAGASPPFAVWGPWPYLPQGKYALVAKAIGKAGLVTSSQPITITIVPYYAVWGPRRLPTGEMLLFYDATEVKLNISMFVMGFDSLQSSNAVVKVPVASPGVFVDETVRGAPASQRFYRTGFGD